MILPLLLAAQAADPSADIVVLAHRAQAVRWNWHVGKTGTLTKCVITKSSGDAEVDQIGCEATRQCAGQGIRKPDAMKACIIPLRRTLLEKLADARVEKAQNASN